MVYFVIVNPLLYSAFYNVSSTAGNNYIPIYMIKEELKELRDILDFAT